MLGPVINHIDYIVACNQLKAITALKYNNNLLLLFYLLFDITFFLYFYYRFETFHADRSCTIIIVYFLKTFLTKLSLSR